MNALAHKQGFLFDLDGTLLDSNGAHALAFQRALEAEAPEFARRFDYADVRGLDTPAALRRLGVAPAPRVARLCDAKRALYREMLRAQRVPLHRGAAELLDALHASGKTIVLVTNASRRTAEEALHVTGIARYFRGVVASDDTPAPKPAPEPFLVALRRFRLDAAACVAVDDAAEGVVASQQAGIDTVLVHGGAAVVAGIENFATLAELLARVQPLREGLACPA